MLFLVGTRSIAVELVLGACFLAFCLNVVAIEPVVNVYIESDYRETYAIWPGCRGANDFTDFCDAGVWLLNLSVTRTEAN